MIGNIPLNIEKKSNSWYNIKGKLYVRGETMTDNIDQKNDAVERLVMTPELEKELSRQWDNIGICNDFVFCKIMQDEELLAELIRRILPELKFTKLYITAQKAVEIGMDIHGVRFDIFAALEDGSVVQIEMQVLDTGNLPRRIRFYSSLADTQMLEKGIVYSKLKDSYIVMICPFDQYGEGRHIYTFTNRCKQDLNLEMGDGTTKIVLNAVGTLDDVSDKLKAFLDYVAGKTVDDEYVKKLDEAVHKARANKEWRREYMTLMMRDLENQEIGLEKGRSIRDREKIEEMLKRGKEPKEIADFCNYPLELILEVQKNLLVLQ